MPRILIVDDDPELLSNVGELFSEEGFDVITARSGADAVALAKARAPELVVCDVAMPGTDGYEVLRALRAHPATATTPFIFLSARAERSDVRAGMNLGADDYVTKPFALPELLAAVQARLRRMQELAARADTAACEVAPHALARTSTGEGVRGERGVVVIDPAMRAMYAQLEPVAKSQLNVLILGETGAGKEVLARAVHALSLRREGPFLPINCAALSEHLLLAELFGHEKGAFTGAVQARVGLLETARGGTVFLDEVGELPLSTQTKLLRVLEERRVLPVGGRTFRDVDVRFVAATNRDLKREIAERTFREDLYYRLNGVSFTVPPLRARRSEIAALSQVFVTRASIEHGRPRHLALSPSALERLEAYGWPGNVRELENVIQRAVVLCTGPRIEPEHLPPEIAQTPDAAAPAGPPGAAVDPTAAERQRVLDALAQSGGNQSVAAEKLGMSRRSLVYRLSAFGLTRSRRRTPRE